VLDEAPLAVRQLDHRAHDASLPARRARLYGTDVVVRAESNGYRVSVREPVLRVPDRCHARALAEVTAWSRNTRTPSVGASMSEDVSMPASLRSMVTQSLSDPIRVQFPCSRSFAMFVTYFTRVAPVASEVAVAAGTEPPQGRLRDAFGRQPVGTAKTRVRAVGQAPFASTGMIGQYVAGSDSWSAADFPGTAS